MVREKYTPSVVEVSKMEEQFLAGKTIKEVMEYLELEIPASCYSETRKRLFERLSNNPQSLKELANGNILNACEIIRHGQRRAASKEVGKQTSILDICDGGMNG